MGVDDRKLTTTSILSLIQDLLKDKAMPGLNPVSHKILQDVGKRPACLIISDANFSNLRSI